MKKVGRIVCVGLLILAMGLTACSKENVEPEGNSSMQQESVAQENSSGVEESSALQGDNDVIDQVSGTTPSGEEGENDPPEGDVSAALGELEAQQKAEQIDLLLESMTLEEKIGQLFFARYPGTGSAPYYAEVYHLGGYILFGVDFEGYSEQGVIDKIEACQDVATIPMLMGVDEEGGTVVRVSSYFRDEEFKSPRDIYEEGGFDLIVEQTREKCELLRHFGLNVNLAPVCDIAGDPWDFMYERSFSGDPEEASKFVGLTVEIMNQYNIGAALKHFPGYGDNADTHTGIAIDYRDAETFYTEDFLPFKAGIEAGAGSIMVSHNIVTCFDGEYPASLSPEVHRIIREDLGYDGVIMTDDLAMGAILDYCGEVNAAVLAIEAGNDLLISTEFASQYNSVLSAVENGRISEARINESVRRVLTFKQQLGLI